MKIAICIMPDQSRCANIIRKMVAAQIMLKFHTSRILPMSGGVAGCIYTSDQFSNIPLFREEPEGNWLMVSGVPISRDENLDKKLHRIVTADYKLASHSLAELDGAFAAVFWDNRHRKMLVVTDFLGMQPLYIFHRGNTLLIATEVKGITASGFFDIKMEPAGWGSFLSFGHLIGNKTMVKGVYRAEPACIYIFDPDNGKFESSMYWQWPSPKPDMTFHEIDTGQIVELLRQDILAYTQHVCPGTVLLSGGFDSRTILALLCEAGFSPDALTIAHNDELFNADGFFAHKIAKQFNIAYKRTKPPRNFFNSEAYLDYLKMTEVMIPSLYLFIAEVSAYITPAMRAIWEGVAFGNALETSHQPAEDFDTYFAKKTLPLESQIWQAAFKLFGRTKAENMYEAFDDLLQQERGKYSEDAFGVYEFMMRNRMRNRTAFSPLKIYANSVLPFTPGFSKALWDAVGSMPSEIRTKGQLYLKIFQRYFPCIENIPIVSGHTLYFRHTQGLNRWIASGIHWLEHCRPIQESKKSLQKLITGSWQYWPESELIPRVISKINPEHPDLNADEVRTFFMQSLPDSFNFTTQEEQRLLFYWQVWRWSAEGQFTTMNKDAISLTSS